MKFAQLVLLPFAEAKPSDSGFAEERKQAQRRQWRMQRACFKAAARLAAPLGPGIVCRNECQGAMEWMRFLKDEKAKDMKVAPTKGVVGMSKGFLYPGRIVSMPREAAERLLRESSADATHLYLALLAREGTEGLGWEAARLQAAQQVLLRLELLDPAQPLQAEPPEKLEPQEPPQYSAQDVTLAMKQGRDFRALVEELQRRLGKLLSPSDLQTLLLLWDFLALPAEVILLLTNWCAQRIAAKYGPGRKPALSQIKTEAFRWQRMGIDSLELAEDYIQKQADYSEKANRLLPILGIAGREAVAAERRYLERWVEQGFDDEAIRLAYEKTVLKKQAMNWPYMNSILRNWNQKGYRTAAQVQEGEGKRWKSPTAAAVPATVGGDSQRLRQDMDRLDRLLQKNQKEG